MRRGKRSSGTVYENGRCAISTRKNRPSGDGVACVSIAGRMGIPVAGEPSSGKTPAIVCMWYSNSAASDSLRIMSSYVRAGALRPRLSCIAGPRGVSSTCGAGGRLGGTHRTRSALPSGIHSNGRCSSD